MKAIAIKQFVDEIGLEMSPQVLFRTNKPEEAIALLKEAIVDVCNHRDKHRWDSLNVPIEWSKEYPELITKYAIYLNEDSEIIVLELDELIL